MGKIKRGGYVFITWKGDHDPRHVHVFEDGREILKWNLEGSVVMKGEVSDKLRRLIEDLVREEKL